MSDQRETMTPLERAEKALAVARTRAERIRSQSAWKALERAKARVRKLRAAAERKP